jgi:Effector protein
MNLNHYNFSINPVGLTGTLSARYVSQVHEHLRWIHRTTSGRILLNCIRSPKFPVEIRPYPTAECNATGGSEQKPGTLKITGMVEYSPHAFSHAGSCRLEPAGEDRGRLGDEMLFHELVHVFRTATGKWNPKPERLTLSMLQYDDNEEFLAVLCTNIYVSDRTNRIKTGLRAGHVNFSAMSPEDAMRFGLFASSQAAFGLIKDFCNDNPIFTKILSDQLPDLVYHPIADFYRFPKICEAFSFFGATKDMAKFTALLNSLGISRSTAQRIAAFLK